MELSLIVLGVIFTSRCHIYFWVSSFTFGCHPLLLDVILYFWVSSFSFGCYPLLLGVIIYFWVSSFTSDNLLPSLPASIAQLDVRS